MVVCEAMVLSLNMVQTWFNHKNKSWISLVILHPLSNISSKYKFHFSKTDNSYPQIFVIFIIVFPSCEQNWGFGAFLMRMLSCLSF